ncbi:hypothetical protein BG006_003941, partial [Podila minutissima]
MVLSESFHPIFQLFTYQYGACSQPIPIRTDTGILYLLWSDIQNVFESISLLSVSNERAQFMIDEFGKCADHAPEISTMFVKDNQSQGQGRLQSQ